MVVGSEVSVSRTTCNAEHGSAFAFELLKTPRIVDVRVESNLEGNVTKSTRKRTSIKQSRPAGKRDLVRRPKASAYAKRTARGRFTEMDDVGRSQKADKRRKAKKTARSGYGDQGDQRPRTSRRTSR